MEVIVLSIHLLVCICLIGLVLLQRSEGGALGMGGGGGALMSGRGAADALAKMTQVAGGFFLVTSLGLTVLSGAGSANAPSVLDLVPQTSAPAITTPATPTEPTTEAPEQARPDPTESSVPATTQLASATIPAEETRAAPLTTRPTTPAPAQAAPRQTAAATPTSAQAEPRQTAPRSTPASTQQQPSRPLILPNSSGAVSGIALDDEASGTESIEIGNGLEAVRRDQRAGPDQ